MVWIAIVRSAELSIMLVYLALGSCHLDLPLQAIVR
jgi:hypothetical protein